MYTRSPKLSYEPPGESKESGTARFFLQGCLCTLLELGLSQTNDKLVHLDHELIPCPGLPPHWISKPPLFYHRPHKVEQLQLCGACEGLHCLWIYRGVWEK